MGDRVVCSGSAPSRGESGIVVRLGGASGPASVAFLRSNGSTFTDFFHRSALSRVAHADGDAVITLASEGGASALAPVRASLHLDLGDSGGLPAHAVLDMGCSVASLPGCDVRVVARLERIAIFLAVGCFDAPPLSIGAFCVEESTQPRKVLEHLRLGEEDRVRGLCIFTQAAGGDALRFETHDDCELPLLMAGDTVSLLLSRSSSGPASLQVVHSSNGARARVSFSDEDHNGARIFTSGKLFVFATAPPGWRLVLTVRGAAAANAAPAAASRPPPRLAHRPISAAAVATPAEPSPTPALDGLWFPVVPPSSTMRTPSTSSPEFLASAAAPPRRVSAGDAPSPRPPAFGQPQVVAAPAGANPFGAVPGVAPPPPFAFGAAAAFDAPFAFAPPATAAAAAARFSWDHLPFPPVLVPPPFLFAAAAPPPPPARRASTGDAPQLPPFSFGAAPLASAATAAAAADEAGGHLDVGDTVCLSDGYAAFGDARRGVLSPGESGLVAARWTGSGTVCVSFRRSPESAVARTWFYERGALRRTAAAGAAAHAQAAAAGGGAALDAAATLPPASTAAFDAASEAARCAAAAHAAAAAAATAAATAANAAAVISLKPSHPAPSSSSPSPAPRLIVVPGARNSAHAVLNVGLLAASLLPASRGGGAWRLDIAVEACAPHAQHASGRNARRLAFGVAIGPSCASLLDDMRSTDTVGQGDGHFAIAQSVGRHGHGPPCAELVTSGETVRTGLPPLAAGSMLSLRLLRRTAGEQRDAAAAASAAADAAAAGAGDAGDGDAGAWLRAQRFAFSPPATPTGDGLFLEIARPGVNTEVLPLGGPGGDEQVFVEVTAPAGTRLALTPYPLPAEPPAAAAAALSAGNNGAAPPAAAAVAADVADAADAAPGDASPAVAAATQQSAATLRSPRFPEDGWAFKPQRQRRSFSAPEVTVRDATAARPNLDKTFAQLRRDVAAAVAQRRESDIAAFGGEGTQSDRFRIDVNCEPGRTLLDDSAAALGPPGSPRGCRA